MKIQQIRNATNKIYYNGKIFLVDPWLAKQYGIGCINATPGHPFTTTDPVKGQIPMPLFELPDSLENILADVDAYILTHVHPDHIDINMADGTIGAPLNHKLPIFTQNAEDAALLQKSGFEDIRILTETGINFDGIRLYKTPAQHGTIKISTEACGVIFQAEKEKTLYVAGDTVWFEGIKTTLHKYYPDVITLNACAAEFVGFGRLIMNDEDVDCVHQTLPQAQLFLTHFDNVAHASLTRTEMRAKLLQRNVSNYVIPEDGKIVSYFVL